MAIAWPVPSRVVQPLRAIAVAFPVALVGCGYGATKPLGSGDDLVVDVDATVAPSVPQYVASGAADSPFGALDGPYGVNASDAYAPIAACTRCACPSGSYCMAGGSGQTAISCGNAEGGSGGDVPGVGCEPLPAACTNEPDCVCLLKSVASMLSCVPVCVEVSGFAVYCPTP